MAAQLPLSKVALFGSYATGNYPVGSDIDVLIVYAGEARPEAHALAKRVLDRPRLEPHLYTEAEHRALRGTWGKMRRDGIVLHGAGVEEAQESPTA